MNNKIQTIIIEDEEINRQLLEHLIKKYCDSFALIGSFDSAESFVESNLIKDVDLIFLDIKLGNKSGFDLTELCDISSKMIIVVTAYSEYMLKSIQNEFLYYLLKPIEITELLNAQKIAEKNYLRFKTSPPENLEQEYITIPMLKKLVRLKIDEIVFIKSQGSYSIFHLENGQETVSTKNIGEYVDLNSKFIRIHHSYVINISKVTSITSNDGDFCILLKNIQVPISRRKKKILIDYLMK